MKFIPLEEIPKNNIKKYLKNLHSNIIEMYLLLLDKNNTEDQIIKSLGLKENSIKTDIKSLSIYEEFFHDILEQYHEKGIYEENSKKNIINIFLLYFIKYDIEKNIKKYKKNIFRDDKEISFYNVLDYAKIYKKQLETYLDCIDFFKIKT